MYFSFLSRAGVLLFGLLTLGACTTVQRNPVPADDYLQTTVLGRHDLRRWGDIDSPQSAIGTDQNDSVSSGIVDTEHHYLAISGGGANGAYGAGLLVGWSKLGTRPEFTLVTGVSTGALIAPFAFLGPTYDERLKALYTTMNSGSIFSRRRFLSIIRNDSVTDSTPLMMMLEKHLTEEMVAEIAREHRRGRVLNVLTTNLDAGRPVIWNIGRIADSGHPGATELIRQVLLASASIPVVFGPVYIKVQGPDSNTYDEMHVDGGTSAQMFLYPRNTNMAQLIKELRVKGTPTAYVIRNSRIQSDYQPVRSRWLDIAGKSVSSLIRTQGIGDAYRIAATSHRDGVDLNLTWIPANAPKDLGDEVFDAAYMSALFEFGYERSLKGTAWTKADLGKSE